MTRRVPSETAPPLRIAMVAACPFPSPRGSQVLMRELAETLADHGHHVHLITYPHGESLVPIRGIFVHRIRPPRFVGSPTGLSWRKIILDLCVAWTLYRVVRRERIQVIHAHNYEGPLISYPIRRLTGVPVVYHSHNALSDEIGSYFRPGWRRWIAQRVGEVLDRQVPRRADFSIALTPELEGFLRAHGVMGERVATIPPSASAGTLPEGGSGGADPFAGRFVVMYAGNLDPYQDLDVLLQGFERFRAQVTGALLVVVTHDVEWRRCAGGRLQWLVQTGAARVVVAQAYATVRRLLVRAEVLVCPRSSWSGFPIKLINYMAAGRPLVVAAGSAKGVVDGETGLIFRNRDEQGLAAALQRLFDDDALRCRLGANARVAVDAAQARACTVPRLVGIYQRLCAQPAGGRRTTVGRHDASPAVMASSAHGRISAASGDRSG